MTTTKSTSISFGEGFPIGYDKAISPSVESGWESYSAERITPFPRINYCTNPASVDTKWGGNASGITYSLETSPPVTFPASFASSTKVIHTSGSYPICDLVSKMSVLSGEVYTASFYIHVAATTESVYFCFYTYNGETIVRDSTPVATISEVNSSFVRIDVSVTIAGSGEDGLRLCFISGVGTGTYYITGCLLEKSATLNSYFDGNTNHAGWLGIENNSTSMLYPPAATNYCKNPKPIHTANLIPSGWSTATPIANTYTWTNGGTYNSIVSKHLNLVNNGGSIYGGINLKDTIYVNEIAAGDQITVSFVIGEATFTGCTIAPYITWYDINGTGISDSWGGAVGSYSEFLLYTSTHTVPANISSFTVSLISNGNFSSGDIQDYSICKVLIEKSSALTPYFDGNTPDCSWAGNDDASVSYRNAYEVDGGGRLMLPAATNYWNNPCFVENGSTGRPVGVNVVNVSPGAVQEDVIANGDGTFHHEVVYTVGAGESGHNVDLTVFTDVGTFAEGDPATIQCEYQLLVSNVRSCTNGTLTGYDQNYASASNTIVPLSAEWASVATTRAACEAGATRRYCYLTLHILATAVEGDTVTLRWGHLNIPKSDLTPYFDGDSPNCSWSGTPNASVSLRAASALEYAFPAEIIAALNTSGTLAMRYVPLATTPGVYTGLFSIGHISTMDSWFADLSTVGSGEHYIRDSSDTLCGTAFANTLSAGITKTFVFRRAPLEVNTDGVDIGSPVTETVSLTLENVLTIGNVRPQTIQACAYIGPVLISAERKSDEWVEAIQQDDGIAFGNLETLWNDFMSDGDMIIPLRENSAAYIKGYDGCVYTMVAPTTDSGWATYSEV